MDHGDHLCLHWTEPVTILEQERPGCNQAHALIAVGEGMVLEEAFPVGRRQVPQR